MKQIITLKEFSTELHSRSVARRIFSELAAQGQGNTFELDFNQVIMMSRSFADEIFEFIDLVGRSKVSIVNTDKNISLILDIVDKNRSVKREFNITGKTKSFGDIDSLKKYLLTI